MRSISFLLALSLFLVFAACSDSNGDSSDLVSVDLGKDFISYQDVSDTANVDSNGDSIPDTIVEDSMSDIEPDVGVDMDVDVGIYDSGNDVDIGDIIDSDISVNYNTFVKIFRGVGSDSVDLFRRTSDNGFIIVGQTDSEKEGIIVVRLDKDMRVVWSKVIGSSIVDDRINDLVEAEDGFVLVGYHYTQDKGWEGLVLKLGLDGNLLWQRLYGGAKRDEFNSVSRFENYFLIVGLTMSFGVGGMCSPVDCTDIWLVKIDADGKLIESRTYGGTRDDWANSIKVSGNNIYIGCGTNSFGSGGNCDGDKCADICLISLKDDLSINWGKAFGGKGWEDISKMVEMNNGSLALIGITDSFGTGLECENKACSDVLLLKVDSNGNLISALNLGTTSPEQVFSIVSDKEENLFLDFVTYGTNSLSGDLALVGIDKENKILSSNIYGGDGFDSSPEIILGGDSIYFAGTTSSFGVVGLYDIWVVKTDSLGSFDRDCIKGIRSDFEPNLGTPEVLVNEAGFEITTPEPAEYNGDLRVEDWKFSVEDICR